jgi:hypothetical protein
MLLSTKRSHLVTLVGAYNVTQCLLKMSQFLLRMSQFWLKTSVCLLGGARRGY